MTSAKILDPICDMVVDLAEARDEGLVVEDAAREYGFCSAGCKTKFAADPAAYVPKIEAWVKKHLSKPFFQIWQELNGQYVFELALGVAPHLTVVSQTASAISGWSFCLGGRPRRLGGTQAGRGTW